MKISIDRMIFEEFPLARIGWLRASVNVSPECERVKELKKQLYGTKICSAKIIIWK